MQGAVSLAGVTKAELVADVQFSQEFRGQRNPRSGSRGSGFGYLTRREPNARWGYYPAVNVSLRPAFDDCRARLHESGPEFWAGNIHEDGAAAPGFLASAFQIIDHTEPHLRVVVGTIDPHAIHAALHEVSDMFVVRTGFGAHCHHDADLAPGWPRAQQSIRIFVEELGAFADSDTRFGRMRQ